LDQEAPSKRRIVPPYPTAHTSVALLPQIPNTSFEGSRVGLDQAEPFQRRIVPADPTAQTLLGDDPQTPEMPLPCGMGLYQHQ
jgi:hypothetical protein